MIITGTLKCTKCGREWKSLINTERPDWKDQQDASRSGKEPVLTLCDDCSRK